MTADALGDRMKSYESAETDRRFMPLCPVMARLDGKCFSTWTRGLEKPYDERMSGCMFDVAMALAEETNPRLAYTQSDEISLVWLQDNHKSEIFHGGRIQKMVSVLASLATAYFASAAIKYFGADSKPAFFDCRVWQVPTKTEAANTILWREIDATKNSVSSAARTVCSHQDLLNKGRADQMDLLMENGINWNDYPAFFKRGRFIQRQRFFGKFTREEIETLPALHNARKDPNVEFERSKFVGIDMPPFGKALNPIAVVFDGVQPRVEG